jgi:hypothetical protein
MIREIRKQRGLEAAATASKPVAVSPKNQTAHLTAAEDCVTTPANENVGSAAEGEPLLDILKRGGELVRVQLQTFKRSTFLDVRVWIRGGDGLVATKKGATIPLERLSELRDALNGLDLPEPPTAAQRAS